MPITLLLTLGPADQTAVEAFLRLIPAQIPVYVFANEPLRILASTLNQCDLFIGNDSGITHLAAAAQCPTVAFFVASEPSIWSPLGEHVRVISLKPPAKR
ncbi:MAG: hypothetical protein C4527_15915 [Candidatus Omnitrophota bacterium]|nr:MAG: hypothetical protein C4527_15915 [Candidatus Omnitrophota bacterium]